MRIEEHRAMIDDCDTEIIDQILWRCTYVQDLHGDLHAKEPRYDYRRETAIAERYADAMEALGIPRVHGYRLAAAVIDAGKAGVRADQAKTA